MIHCLALPIFLSVLPSVPLFESLHGWTHPVFAALILPTVIQASRHAGSTSWVRPLLVGGFLALIIGWSLGHALENELLEIGLTIAGSVLLVIGHVINYRHHRACKNPKHHHHPMLEKVVDKTCGILLCLIVYPAFTGLLMAQSFSEDSKQTDEDLILNSIETFFDGMRLSDSSMIRPLLAQNAKLFGVGSNREGVVAARWSEFDGFLSAVGTPKVAVWNEQVGNVVIHKEGDLATAWMDFVFYRGGELSHCGVNVIHFARESSGWKMFSLGDTRKTDCDEMAEIYPIQEETHVHQ